MRRIWTEIVGESWRGLIQPCEREGVHIPHSGGRGQMGAITQCRCSAEALGDDIDGRHDLAVPGETRPGTHARTHAHPCLYLSQMEGAPRFRWRRDTGMLKFRLVNASPGAGDPGRGFPLGQSPCPEWDERKGSARGKEGAGGRRVPDGPTPR